MGEHPYFNLKSYEDFNKQDSLILLKPIYNKKIMFTAAKPNNKDYIEESEQQINYLLLQNNQANTFKQLKSCFLYCEPKHKKPDEKFQNCLKTCLAKWKGIHEYTSTPEFSGLFLPKKLK
ncbi:hypothetical protein TTHERM_00772020 (macronuclear) [Tetrahymena thermophila SB210]|uniref:Tim10/DDP family zinc finger protein n=1 Tax=Tetrahymena thermophila (strain SB210) TaxID=312017 RepID=Q23AP6_TETTS|nr:hypothetical protein TTHERM_00772020 [Tetrahymena thermophila SB210]EAR93646.1 hypothetical protein TTHERM_00772020 [Tetrahymena thermophila SB210]|eukprot:XP_001013891.1 hypothetical protein TTHERM_00772020 [Tetrahymena thermophila SB210]